MNTLVPVLWPEILLITVASGLFLLGIVNRPAARRLAAALALATLVLILLIQAFVTISATQDAFNTLYVYGFARYVNALVAAVGVMLVLLAWPSNPDARGNSALDFGYDAGEFFALMLISLAGVMLVAGANDIILLFLGIELASFPTYIMVSISRPLPVAQEAGVKYFFLGAMAAAVMLFGFSYLYGTTGYTHLDEISAALQAGKLNGSAHLPDWQLFAIVMLLAGFAFKIAAVPLHAYAGDVYQGAATPVTAFLAFVPKTSGFIAILKILYMLGGPTWTVDDRVVWLLWIIAALTMTFGNALALLPFNIKRVLAYSSVAHSGYMLVGVTALVAARGDKAIQDAAIAGVLFYLAAYGIMNTGAFGVLMALPARDRAHGTAQSSSGSSAETFEDIAGQGRAHIALGLAMTVCCLSLTGIPLTVGFFGKVFLIKPALQIARAGDTRMAWLVVIMMVNAAVSAAYYLKIVARMFLGAETTNPAEPIGVTAHRHSMALGLAIFLSVFGTLLIGIVPAATNTLSYHIQKADLEPGTTTAVSPLPSVAASR